MISDWETKKFGDCAFLVKEIINPAEAPSTYYVGLEHIGESSLSLLSFGESESVESSKYKFKKGDILFGKLRPYFRKVVIAPFDGICSTDIWVVRAKDGIDQNFLFYWMASNKFVDAASRGSEGTRMPRAKWDFVSQLEELIPSYKEQKCIANLLSSLSKKIEHNNCQNEMLDKIARAIFKSWFIDFDPVRAKAEGKQPFGMDEETAALFPSEFEDSELGEIPKSWQCIALSDICTTQYGYTESATTEPVGPHFLRVMDINKANWVDWQEVPYCHITPQLFEKYQLYPGDIVVARMADPGKSALIEEEIDAVFASYLVRLKFDSMSISNYIYHFLKSNIYKEYCECVKSGSVQSNMNAKVITGVKLILPPSEIIEAFYQFISPMRRKIINNVAENATLAEIRDALLPKLLSGEIRVPVEAD